MKGNSDMDKQIQKIMEYAFANISKALEMRHWSRNELSNQADISSGTMSKWFRSLSVPSIKNLILISNVLDMSMARLFAKNKDEEHDAKRQELLDEFDRLTPIQQEKLLDFIKHAM